MNEFHDPDDVLGHASHSQLPPHGLVQVLRKVAYVVAVQPGHRDTPVLRQVDVRLLRQRLTLLWRDARETARQTQSAVSVFVLDTDRCGTMNLEKIARRSERSEREA